MPTICRVQRYYSWWKNSCWTSHWHRWMFRSINSHRHLNWYWMCPRMERSRCLGHHKNVNRNRATLQVVQIFTFSFSSCSPPIGTNFGDSGKGLRQRGTADWPRLHWDQSYRCESNRARWLAERLEWNLYDVALLSIDKLPLLCTPFHSSSTSPPPTPSPL